MNTNWLHQAKIRVVPSCWNFICICYTVCLVYVAIPLYYWLTAKMQRKNALLLYVTKCNEKGIAICNENAMKEGHIACSVPA